MQADVVQKLLDLNQTFYDTVADVGLSGHFENSQLVFVSYLSTLDVLELDNVIGFYVRREDGEAMLDVESVFVAMHKDADYFDEVSRTGQVDVVSQQNDFLVTRHSAG